MTIGPILTNAQNLLVIEISKWEKLDIENSKKVFDSLEDLNTAFIKDATIEKIVNKESVSADIRSAYKVFTKRHKKIKDESSSLILLINVLNVENLL